MAILAAVLFHAVLLLILLFTFLKYKYPPDDPMELEMTKEEIMFGGEYVMLGDFPLADASQSAAANPEDALVSEDQPVVGEDMRDAGEAQDAPKQMVTSVAEAPMKVEKKKTKEEPKSKTKSETAEQEKIKAQQQAQKQQINKRVNFGTGGAGAGAAGSTNGNSTSGARAGKPGVGGLSGYTLERWGKPTSGVDGKIVIRVTVNQRGTVTSASYSSGSGSAAADAKVRESCRQASLQSQFAVPANTTGHAIGYITWNFP